MFLSLLAFTVSMVFTVATLLHAEGNGRKQQCGGQECGAIGLRRKWTFLLAMGIVGSAMLAGYLIGIAPS